MSIEFELLPTTMLPAMLVTYKTGGFRSNIIYIIPLLSTLTLKTCAKILVIRYVDHWQVIFFHSRPNIIYIFQNWQIPMIPVDKNSTAYQLWVHARLSRLTVIVYIQTIRSDTVSFHSALDRSARRNYIVINVYTGTLNNKRDQILHINTVEKIVW